MAEPLAVKAPAENVNDETIAVVRWLVEDGAAVEKDSPILLAETSKTSFDIPAPVAGFVWTVARSGTDVPIGALLCFIGDDVAAARAAAQGANGGHAAVTPASPGTSSLPSPMLDATAVFEAAPRETPALVVESMQSGVRAKTRFSTKALTLIEQHRLDRSVFEGRSLVKEEDVSAFLAVAAPPARKPASPPAPEPVPAPAPVAQQRPVRGADGVPTRVETLRRSKRLEARHLRASLDSTILSAVTVTVPTSGFFSVSQHDPKSVGLASAAIIFETARLLRTYPVFNAFYNNGNAHYYEQVNVGYALDIGKGLKVPVIRDADRKPLPEIASEKQQRLVEYLDDSLPVAALSGGTFTITDLSGEDVFHFQPVINEGQSAILGICSEWRRGGDPPAAFNLVLAFDHQLAEGRTAARFLHDLRDRIRGHEESMRGALTTSEEDPVCSVCRRPLSELEETRHHLVTTVRPGTRTQTLCTICLADW